MRPLLLALTALSAWALHGAPGRAEAPPPRLALFPVDASGRWDPSRVEELPPGASQGALLADLRILDPTACAPLDDEGRRALLETPARLLASQRRRALVTVPTLLLVAPPGPAGSHAILIDRDSGRRRRLSPPSWLEPAQALRELIEEGLRGTSPAGGPALITPSSRRYHRPDARHLDPHEPSEPVGEEGQASARGFRPCRLCYPEGELRESLDPEARRSGARTAARIQARYLPSPDLSLRARVAAIGGRLVEANPPASPDLRFLVLDSPEIRAMGAPAGQIYLTAGLAELLTDDELAAALARELALLHLQRGLGGAWQARWARGAGRLLGETLLGPAGRGLGGALTAAALTRAQLLEADQEAILWTFAAGFEPRGALRALTRLQGAGGGHPLLPPEDLLSRPTPTERRDGIEAALTRLAPLQAALEELERQGDRPLADQLRLEVRGYLEDPRPIQAFLEACSRLSSSGVAPPPPLAPIP